MQSNQGSAPTPPDAAAQAPAAVDALARRRLLLKGLGKGAGAAAALVPIQTLATTAPTRLCTVSGIHSNVGSGRTGGTTDQCRGHAPSFYATLANWPGYDTLSRKVSFSVNSTSYSQKSTFRSVFGGGSTTKLIDIVRATTTSSQPNEQVWVTALLNALKRNGGANLGTDGYFPYSAPDVVALYNNATKRADAEYLFATYLQLG